MSSHDDHESTPRPPNHTNPIRDNPPNATAMSSMYSPRTLPNGSEVPTSPTRSYDPNLSTVIDSISICHKNGIETHGFNLLFSILPLTTQILILISISLLSIIATIPLTTFISANYLVYINPSAFGDPYHEVLYTTVSIACHQLTIFSIYPFLKFNRTPTLLLLLFAAIPLYLLHSFVIMKAGNIILPCLTQSMISILSGGVAMLTLSYCISFAHFIQGFKTILSAHTEKKDFEPDVVSVSSKLNTRDGKPHKEGQYGVQLSLILPWMSFLVIALSGSFTMIVQAWLLDWGFLTGNLHLVFLFPPLFIAITLIYLIFIFLPQTPPIPLHSGDIDLPLSDELLGAVMGNSTIVDSRSPYVAQTNVAVPPRHVILSNPLSNLSPPTHPSNNYNNNRPNSQGHQSAFDFLPIPPPCGPKFTSKPPQPSLQVYTEQQLLSFHPTTPTPTGSRINHNNSFPQTTGCLGKGGEDNLNHIAIFRSFWDFNTLDDMSFCFTGTTNDPNHFCMINTDNQTQGLGLNSTNFNSATNTNTNTANSVSFVSHNDWGTPLPLQHEPSRMVESSFEFVSYLFRAPFLSITQRITLALPFSMTSQQSLPSSGTSTNPAIVVVPPSRSPPYDHHEMPFCDRSHHDKDEMLSSGEVEKNMSPPPKLDLEVLNSSCDGGGAFNQSFENNLWNPTERKPSNMNISSSDVVIKPYNSITLPSIQMTRTTPHAFHQLPLFPSSEMPSNHTNCHNQSLESHKRLQFFLALAQQRLSIYNRSIVNSLLAPTTLRSVQPSAVLDIRTQFDEDSHDIKGKGDQYKYLKSKNHLFDATNWTTLPGLPNSKRIFILLFLVQALVISGVMLFSTSFTLAIPLIFPTVDERGMTIIGTSRNINEKNGLMSMFPKHGDVGSDGNRVDGIKSKGTDHQTLNFTHNHPLADMDTLGVITDDLLQTSPPLPVDDHYPDSSSPVISSNHHDPIVIETTTDLGPIPPPPPSSSSHLPQPPIIEQIPSSNGDLPETIIAAGPVTNDVIDAIIFQKESQYIERWIILWSFCVGIGSVSSMLLQHYIVYHNKSRHRKLVDLVLKKHQPRVAEIRKKYPPIPLPPPLLQFASVTSPNTMMPLSRLLNTDCDEGVVVFHDYTHNILPSSDSTVITFSSHDVNLDHLNSGKHQNDHEGDVDYVDNNEDDHSSGGSSDEYTALSPLTTSFPHNRGQAGETISRSHQAIIQRQYYNQMIKQYNDSFLLAAMVKKLITKVGKIISSLPLIVSFLGYDSHNDLLVDDEPDIDDGNDDVNSLSGSSPNDEVLFRHRSFFTKRRKSQSPAIKTNLTAHELIAILPNLSNLQILHQLIWYHIIIILFVFCIYAIIFPIALTHWVELGQSNAQLVSDSPTRMIATTIPTTSATAIVTLLPKVALSLSIVILGLASSSISALFSLLLEVVAKPTIFLSLYAYTQVFTVGISMAIPILSHIITTNPTIASGPDSPKSQRENSNKAGNAVTRTTTPTTPPTTPTTPAMTTTMIIPPTPQSLGNNSHNFAFHSSELLSDLYHNNMLIDGNVVSINVHDQKENEQPSLNHNIIDMTEHQPQPKQQQDENISTQSNTELLLPNVVVITPTHDHLNRYNDHLEHLSITSAFLSRLNIMICLSLLASLGLFWSIWSHFEAHSPIQDVVEALVKLSVSCTDSEYHYE